MPQNKIAGTGQLPVYRFLLGWAGCRSGVDPHTLVKMALAVLEAA